MPDDRDGAGVPPGDRVAALTALEPRLRTAVLRFNHLPVDYIDHQRLAADQALPATVWARLVASRRLTGSLSRWLLHRHQLADDYCYDFDSPLRRLALATVAELERVAAFAGVLLHARTIAKVVARGPLDTLRAVIGVDGLGFAVKRAAFLKPPLERPRPTDMVAAVQRDGRSCLAAWLAEQPRAIRARVVLKFPPGSAVEDPDPDLVGAPGRIVLERTLRERGVAPWPVSSA